MSKVGFLRFEDCSIDTLGLILRDVQLRSETRR